MTTARPLARSLAAVAAAALLAGCTTASDDPPPTASPTSSPTPSASPADRVVLQVAAYGDERRERTYRRIAEAFEAAHPDVRVEVTTVASAEEATERAVRELASGTAPDVFLADAVYLPRLVATGGLQPVDTLLEDRGLQFGDDYQRVGLNAFSANARLQCMPAELSPLVVFANMGLVPRRQLAAREVLVPRTPDDTWSWEDFVLTARTVAGLDQLGPIKGAAIPPSLEVLTAFVRSAGGEVVDDVLEPTSLTLATEDALAAAGQVATLARDPAVSVTPRQLQRREAVEWFADGRLGMYVGTRDDVPRLRGVPGLRFDVLPLPSLGRVRSVAEANGWCLAAAGEHQAEAADFVQFAVGPDGAAIAARSGSMVPANLDAIHQDAFLQPGRPPRNAGLFATALRRTDPLPYSLAWPQVSREAGAVLAQLYGGRGELDEERLERRLARLNERSEVLFAAAAPQD